MNEIFLRFCFADDLFKSHFFTRCLYLFHNWWWEREEDQLFKSFENLWRILLKVKEKIFEIHKHCRLSIFWIFKKSNSVQTLVEDILEIKLSYRSLLSKTYKKPASQFESLRVNCSGSNFFTNYKSNVIFFLLACNADSNFQLDSQLRVPTQKKIVYTWAKGYNIFAHLEAVSKWNWKYSYDHLRSNE